MARRMRSLNAGLLAELPSGCPGCAFWESRERLPRHCGAACDLELVEGWAAWVRAQWGPFGKVAVEDGQVLGFIKYAPSAYFPQARHFPPGPPSDDAVLIACMHLLDDARHLGLGSLLLHAALRDLHGRGERVVEAYATSGSYVDLPVMSLDFLLRQGFTVHRPHPEFPLLRLKLKSLAAWTENVEAVLQTLHLPVRAPKRVAVPSVER